MKAAIPLAALALALSGCAATVNHPIVDGGPVRSDGLARLGQPTAVGALVATPQRVVEDSRCPINARCVWAGRLILSTRIDGAGWRETVNLTLGQPYRTHGMGLALTSAEPGRVAGDQPPADMTFGFEPR